MSESLLAGDLRTQTCGADEGRNGQSSPCHTVPLWLLRLSVAFRNLLARFSFFLLFLVAGGMKGSHDNCVHLETHMCRLFHPYTWLFTAFCQHVVEQSQAVHGQLRPPDIQKGQYGKNDPNTGSVQKVMAIRLSRQVAVVHAYFKLLLLVSRVSRRTQRFSAPPLRLASRAAAGRNESPKTIISQ